MAVAEPVSDLVVDQILPVGTDIAPYASAPCAQRQAFSITRLPAWQDTRPYVRSGQQ